MRAFCFRLLTLWTALLPPAADAQWPGEVEGRVVDALSGRGVEAASVRLPDLPRPVLTDGSGRFHLRAVASGVHDLTVARIGYSSTQVRVQVEAGRVARPTVELVPAALETEGVTARVSPTEAGAHRVVRGSPGTAGARTVADWVEALPGVRVTGRGAGSARTASIRGSAPDAVLVLLDGVPVNDPVTGEADLSLIPAQGVEEVTVLPGARSARYGPRAEAGVIQVRTGRGAPGLRARGSAGSLGRTGGGVEWTAGDAPTRGFVSASAERLDGGFSFRKDAAAGGGSATRRNADLERWAVRIGGETDGLGGGARARFGADGLVRGLPGRSFAPSVGARQAERRFNGSLAWDGAVGGHPAELELYGATHRARVRDPSPLAGLPYDETTRVGQVGVRALVRHASPPAGLHEVTVGWEVEHQAVRADVLEGSVPRTDAGAFVAAARRFLDDRVRVRGVARLHRDGAADDLVGSHEVGVSMARGAVVLRAAHRSAWSPPALADRFFRAGVGVEPNPDLEAERIPSELEAGISLAGPVGPWRMEGSLDLYRSDVRGMIVWSPDFRFVWSPRNVDVRRRGLDLAVSGTTPLGPGRVRLASTWSLARVTYARTDLRHLQLRYRPRHSAHIGAGWDGPGHSISVDARYVGSRLPTPSNANRLPGFWTVDLSGTATLDVGGWRLEPALRVDRIRDVRHSMIFAFPDPGRTWAFELAVGRAPGPS